MWAAGIALVIFAVSLVVNNVDIVAVAQITVALGTLAIASLAYAPVREMREVRIAQERPHVIVDADYGHRDVISVIVRNTYQRPYQPPTRTSL